MTELTIISRAEWGAKHPAGFADLTVPATELWLHHSVTQAPDLLPPYDDDYAAVRTLERIGQQRFGGGISYTFAVSPLGLVFEGTGVWRRGAHTKGHNTAGRAIVLIGDYGKNPPTRRQVEAVGLLTRLGREKGWWTVGRLTGGHRDAEPPGYTECPGAFAYRAISEINEVAAGWPVPPPAPPKPPIIVHPGPVPPRPGNFLARDFPLPAGHYLGTPRPDRACHSGYYSRADQAVVLEWQRAMVRRGWNVTADGKFGPSSAKVAAAFQREKGLAVDGCVGKVTWHATDVLPR